MYCHGVGLKFGRRDSRSLRQLAVLEVAGLVSAVGSCAPCQVPPTRSAPGHRHFPVRGVAGSAANGEGCCLPKALEYDQPAGFTPYSGQAS